MDATTDAKRENIFAILSYRCILCVMATFVYYWSPWLYDTLCTRHWLSPFLVCLHTTSPGSFRSPPSVLEYSCSYKCYEHNSFTHHNHLTFLPVFNAYSTHIHTIIMRKTAKHQQVKSREVQKILKVNKYRRETVGIRCGKHILLLHLHTGCM